jgi:hypothetical protein
MGDLRRNARVAHMDRLRRNPRFRAGEDHASRSVDRLLECVLVCLRQVPVRPGAIACREPGDPRAEQRHSNRRKERRDRGPRGMEVTSVMRNSSAKEEIRIEAGSVAEGRLGHLETQR